MRIYKKKNNLNNLQELYYRWHKGIIYKSCLTGDTKVFMSNL